MYITLAKGQAMLQDTQHASTADVRCKAVQTQKFGQPCFAMLADAHCSCLFAFANANVVCQTLLPKGPEELVSLRNSRAACKHVCLHVFTHIVITIPHIHCHIHPVTFSIHKSAPSLSFI